MKPSAYGIFQIGQDKVTGDPFKDVLKAKFRYWNYLKLAHQDKNKLEGKLIRVEFDEHNLLPFDTGKEFTKFVKNRVKNTPEEITVKYLA